MTRRVGALDLPFLLRSKEEVFVMKAKSDIQLPGKNRLIDSLVSLDG
jgi:hypothetical protein